jgi:hypothetical protein
MKEKLGRMGNRKITIGVKKPRKGVSCAGCAFLAFVAGYPPLCLEKATFVDGAIYTKTDITGTRKAEEVNKKRNCPDHRRFSLRARTLRHYLYKDCRKEGRKYGKEATPKA